MKDQDPPDLRETQPFLVNTKLQQRVAVVSRALVGMLILSSAYTLYFIRPVLLPVILALLISLVLNPIQKLLRDKLRLPSPIAAAIILTTLIIGIGSAFYSLSIPAFQYTQQLRTEIVQNRLKDVFQPVSNINAKLTKVASEVEEITSPPAIEEEEVDSPNDDSETEKNIAEKAPPKSIAKKKLAEPMTEPAPKAGPVEVRMSSNPMQTLTRYLRAIAYNLFITLALVYFLLAFGEKMLKRITEVKVTAEVFDQITVDVSSYLLSITLINIGLGIVTGLAMWGLGMPNPILWGVMAATLNFIPYIGAIMGTIVIFLVATTHFDDRVTTLMIPLVYYSLTFLEGNLITPAILGKRFTVNPIVIFIWVLAWGAFWGIPGMLIGLPLLMVFRIVFAQFPAFERIERIISS